MTLLYRSALLTTLLVFALALALPARAQAPTDTVATINGTPLTVADFERTYIGFLLATGENDTPRNRYRHLDDRIVTHLLAEEARREGLHATPDFRLYEERVRQKALGGRFFETAFLETLPPLTEAEIREAYVRSKTQVITRHLFYREEGAAWAAHARLEDGGDFLEEARLAYGLSAIDSTAGFLGPIRYFAMDDAFAEAAFALDVGAYSAPVRSRFGYHIIRAEDRIIEPLLTESEFQTRQGGMASQMRLRKRRLEGDRFVQAFMEGLNVRVDPAAVSALAEAVEAVENSVAPEPVAVAGDLEAVPVDPSELRAALTPETVLATYTLGGETVAFTAGDYYFWLPELTFEEARHRTAASLGRALRNDALTRAAEATGLAADSVVAQEVVHFARLRLAAHMQAHLRALPPLPLNEETLRAAFEGTGLAKKKTWTANFWVLPFASQTAAEAARALLDDDPTAAANLPGFTEHRRADLDADPTWKPHVIRTPLRTPSLVHTNSDGWAVLYVSDRTAETVSFETMRPTLVENLAPLAREYALLKDLRAAATITVDTERFEAMMRLGK